MIPARTFILAILVGSSISAVSQVVWNIGYIEIDSISAKDVGRLVKLDFRNNHRPANEAGEISIRSRDTAQLELWGDTIEFKELRIISPDWGEYVIQGLVCPNYKPDRQLEIDESEIMDIKADSILFKLHTSLYHTKKGKIKGDATKDTALAWIEKSRLDGVMFKNGPVSFINRSPAKNKSPR